MVGKRPPTLPLNCLTWFGFQEARGVITHCPLDCSLQRERIHRLEEKIRRRVGVGSYITQKRLMEEMVGCWLLMAFATMISVGHHSALTDGRTLAETIRWPWERARCSSCVRSWPWRQEAISSSRGNALLFSVCDRGGILGCRRSC